MLLIAKAWLFVVFCFCMWLFIIIVPWEVMVVSVVSIGGIIATIWSIAHVSDNIALKKAEKISSNSSNRKFLRTEGVRDDGSG